MQSKQIIQVLPINQHQKLELSSSLSVSYCNLSQMHLRRLQPEATFRRSHYRRELLKMEATKNGKISPLHFGVHVRNTNTGTMAPCS